MYNLTFESSYPTPYSSSPFLYLILLSMTGQKHTPDTTTEIRDIYDYIIVGSGSAGSVVASRLAEKECVTVLLLEAGKPPPKLTDIPVISRSFVYTDLDWKFMTVPQKHTGAGIIDRSLVLSAGKTVGGSSAINGMQAIRGNKRDYDIWAQMGASGWSYNEVLPYFKKLEDNKNPEFVRSGYHGVGGPVTFSMPRYESKFGNAVFETGRRMGYSIVDSNGETQMGFDKFQSLMRNGQRCSAAKAYLVPSENKENLDIVANAYVKKVSITNRNAKGVVFDFQGRSRKVKARREVILSAGTIKSAHILMLSGIGPKEELAKHKIPLVADLPVGHNLQEQFGAILDFELDGGIRPFMYEMSDSLRIWQYILRKTGPLTSLSGTTNMAFLKRDEGSDDYPDFQLYFGEGIHNLVKKQLRMIPKFHQSIYEPYKTKPFYWCLSQILRPKGRGIVFLNSSDPYNQPLIDPMYFSHPDDLEVVIQGMKKCKEVGTSEPLREIGSQPFRTIYPGCESKLYDDDEYFRCVARSVILSCSHQVGTVRMGNPDDPDAVLDPQLRVKTIKNLRVIDASIMPIIPSGNTHVPTMMIAEKAADMIKEHIQCQP